MVDAVESTEEVSGKIEESAREIKEAAAVAKQNGEKCRQIEKRVDRVVAMLDWLAKSKTAREAVIRSDLEDLGETLDLALKLVTGCQQEKKVTWLRCVAAGNLSKRLRQVNRNILESITRLVNNVHNNIVFGTQNIHEGILMPPPEDAADESTPHSINDRSHVKEKETSDPAGREAATISSGLPEYSLDFLKNITNNFASWNELCRDIHATAYKGILHDYTEVTVWLFSNKTGLADQLVNQYLRVFSALGHHENIVTCLGFYHEVFEVSTYDNGEILEHEIHGALVNEYCPMGSLDRYVGIRASYDTRELDWSVRFHVIRGIAEGVAHFHTKNVIHLGLFPENIFLDADMTPKIYGFSVSKILGQEGTEITTDEFVGTQHNRSMAPEYVLSGTISVKNDVYSFGVLVLCFLTRSSYMLLEDPPAGTRQLDEDTTQILGFCVGFKQSEEKSVRGCIQIGLMCTEEKPEDRPSMPEILDMLDGRKEILLAPKYEKNAGCEPVDPPMSVTDFTFSELEDATDKFSKENLIGESHIATVYKGLLNGKKVAVKRFHHPWGPPTIAKYKEFFSPSFQHENIVRFLGYCEKAGQETVVEEYFPSRCLSKIIEEPHGMDWRSRFQIIRGVANALDYLHTKHIVHFDLTPANIVIFDNQMNPKICDFGLSKILMDGGLNKIIVDGGTSEIVTKEFEITAGSTAPEYADGIISVKNDVYSFGDLVCALSGMSRFGPPQDLNNVATVVREARRMKELFDPSSCKETQLKQIKECMDIGLRCTRIERGRRPTFKEILEILNKTDHKVSSTTKNIKK